MVARLRAAALTKRGDAIRRYRAGAGPVRGHDRNHCDAGPAARREVEPRGMGRHHRRACSRSWRVGTAFLCTSSATPQPIPTAALWRASCCKVCWKRWPQVVCYLCSTAGAEPLYRSTFGSKISLGNLFRPRGMRTKSFFLGTILGLSLTGAFVAYQIAFYMLAYRFGAWSPADVPYSDLLNTRLPWAFVLFGGFLPAVSEEFLFRMFAIPFLRNLVRSVIAALGSRRLPLGLWPRRISATAVLHSRPGSGHRRNRAGRRHVAMGNPAHAGMALLHGRHVQRAAVAAVAQSLLQALRRGQRRHHGSACSHRTGGLHANGRLRTGGGTHERQRDGGS